MNNLKTEGDGDDSQSYKMKRQWEKKALTDTEAEITQSLSPERKRNKTIKKI